MPLMSENDDLEFDKGTTKKVLHAGAGDVPIFSDSARISFHFRSEILKYGEVGDTLDDSRKYGQPMELIIGKQFKMPVWEACLKTMRVGEVAQFDVEKNLVVAYPVVSKGFRQFVGVLKKEDDSMRHCCGMMALKETCGSSDLDKFLREPESLRFTIELLKVELPGEYEKETWSMSPEEKLDSVPELREEGNVLYRNKKFEEASEKYALALGRLEQLMLREKPGEEEWNSLEKMKLPILLNYSQCKLLENDYYRVIEFTSEILDKEPDNAKALYKRAKAHVGSWDIDSARQDYTRLLSLDPNLQNTVKKELRLLDSMQKQKDEEDKKKFQGKMF